MAVCMGALALYLTLIEQVPGAESNILLLKLFYIQRLFEMAATCSYHWIFCWLFNWIRHNTIPHHGGAPASQVR